MNKVNILGVIGVHFLTSNFRLTYVAEPLLFSAVGDLYTDINLEYNMGYGKIFPLSGKRKM